MCEKKTLDSVMYHLNPPRSFPMYLYSGLTSVVKLWIFPDFLLSKILPRATSDSRKMLSNDNMSTGLVDKLYSHTFSLH